MASRFWWSSWASLALCSVATSLYAPAAARARPPAWRVWVRGDGCPGAAVLERQLTPLLPPGSTLEVLRGVPADGEGVAVVEDLGDEYRVEAGAGERELLDPRRDCLERARVVAIWLVLNVDPRSTASADQRELVAPIRFGVEAFGTAAYAGELVGPAAGGGAGAWLEVADLEFAFAVSWLAGGERGLGLAETPGARATLTRFPMAATASYRFGLGAVSFAPTAGLLLDVLRVRGAALPEPESALRINPGIFAGASGELALGGAWLLRVRAGLEGFARAYRLELAPELRAGELPRLWFGAALGLGLRL